MVRDRKGRKADRQERLQPGTVDCHRNRQIVDPDAQTPGSLRQWSCLPLSSSPSLPQEEPERERTASSSLPERRLDPVPETEFQAGRIVSAGKSEDLESLLRSDAKGHSRTALPSRRGTPEHLSQETGCQISDPDSRQNEKSDVIDDLEPEELPLLGTPANMGVPDLKVWIRGGKG